MRYMVERSSERWLERVADAGVVDEMACYEVIDVGQSRRKIIARVCLFVDAQKISDALNNFA